MKIKDKVLIVEDEQSISNFISMVLNANGYDTIIVGTGEEALTMIASHCPDLIVLDLGLPDMDGMEVLQVRAQVVQPAGGGGLRPEPRARQGGRPGLRGRRLSGQALRHLRAAGPHPHRHPPYPHRPGQSARSPSPGNFTAGDLTIDYDKHQVLIRGENAKLTVNEYKIVALLGKYAGKVLTYDFIIRELWGPKAKADNQILRVNMANIRRKIEENPGQPEYIFTEVGVGYRMREGD